MERQTRRPTCPSTIPKPPFPAQKHALRKSLDQSGKGGAAQPTKGRKPKKVASGQREMLKKVASGQREMLMAISGKGEGKAKPAAKLT